MLLSWLEVGARAPPVLPDEVSAVAEQVLLGGPAQFEGPEVVQAHLGRARLARIAAKQVMNLKSMKKCGPITKPKRHRDGSTRLQAAAVAHSFAAAEVRRAKHSKRDKTACPFHPNSL